MAERGNETEESAEQFEKRFIEFIKSLEFGTSQYQATSDYFHLKGLEDSLKINKANATSELKGTESREYWESQARITEQEIALHRLQIYNNRSRVEGYEDAYTHVGVTMEFSAYDVAKREARRLFPNDERQQDIYIDEFRERIFGDADETVTIKRK
jgi:hypothetical protein